MSNNTIYKQPEQASLDELMMRLGWSGQDLMRHIDVDKNTVSNWRTGTHRIPKVVLLYLNLLLRFHEKVGSFDPRPGASSSAHGSRENV